MVQKTWWEGAKEPGGATVIQLAAARPDWGGCYFIVKLSDSDGKELMAQGYDLFRLDSVKKRVVTLSAHKSGEIDKRWASTRSGW